MLKCGFYEIDVTPYLGSIIPGDFKARYNKGVSDKLYVRAFAVSDGGSNAAIAVIDACGITKDITDRIRERVTAAVPLKPQDIMIMATHTHSGGPTLNWGEQVRRDEFYIDNLIVKAADSIILSYQNMKESQLRLGETLLNGHSFIRVYDMKDGSLMTNPGMLNPNAVAPHGTIDPELSVLSVEVGGVIRGAVINFACHPAIVCGDYSSGDFIGVLSERMKQKYGDDFITVFINGACGNINHIDITNPETNKNGAHIRIGNAIAEHAVLAMENATDLIGGVSVAEKNIHARTRKPSPEYVKAAAEQLYSRNWAGGESEPGTPGYVDTFFALEALKIASEKLVSREIYLQKICIGELEIFGVPCQIFTEFGKKIKEGRPGKTCMISAFANDYCGYVPTPDCFKPGVYEARLAQTSKLAPETGDEVCKAAIEMHE